MADLRAREFMCGSVLCSARLQAGILLIPKCPPEGERYTKPEPSSPLKILES